MLANRRWVLDNHAVNTWGLLRRLTACLAVVSLLGWLELPLEHLHTAAAADHAVAHVHRHVAVHAVEHHDHAPVDHAQLDHDEDAVYLTGQTAVVSRPVAAPQLAVAGSPAPALVARPVPSRLTAPTRTVRVHPPPWRVQYARRGPPAFTV